MELDGVAAGRNRRPTRLSGALALVLCALAAGALRGVDPALVDRPLSLALQSTRIPWLTGLVSAVTRLGDPLTLGSAVVATALVSLHRSDPRAAAVLVVAGLAAVALSQSMKWAFHLPRPETIRTFDPPRFDAFPSGHALGSAAVYGTIGTVVSRLYERAASVTPHLAASAAAAVGISRVYLGMHWPSDVLAGWSLGALLALGAAASLDSGT